MTDRIASGIHQKNAYNSAYRNADAIPFPDHKIEGDQVLLGKSIVSVGGGTGSDIAHLAGENQVYVIDYSDTSAPIARTFGIHPIQADLNSSTVQLPFAPGSIDVLVLKDVLEHLIDPEAALRMLLPLLRPNGYVVISLPNHLTLWGRLRVLFGANLVWKGIMHDHSTEYMEWNYMHIRFFTWAGVQKLLRQNGLRITQTFFDFGPFGHYFSIPMYAEHLKLKDEQGLLTPKGRLFLQFGYPFYRFLNLIFPKKLRQAICYISPSLFTSCFYIHARKCTST